MKYLPKKYSGTSAKPKIIQDPTSVVPKIIRDPTIVAPIKIRDPTSTLPAIIPYYSGPNSDAPASVTVHRNTKL
jgi:hypothetical protein